MAGQPMKRAAVKLIEALESETGARGIQVVIERLAAGQTISRQAQALGISRYVLAQIIRKQVPPEEVIQARRDCAAAMIDETLDIADASDDGRIRTDAERIKARQWIGARFDRDTFGERPQVQVNVDMGSIFTAALEEVNKLSKQQVSGETSSQIVDVEPQAIEPSSV